MKLYLHCVERQRCFSNITECCACHAKWLSWLIRVTYETLFTMRGATEMSLQHHQILRLPRKVTLIIDPLHTWNVIYNARSNMCHSPNSPNTARATKHDSHHGSLSHMKRYLQCAEQQVSLPNLINLTKYCACHPKWLSKIKEFLQNRWNVIYNARPIRDRFEHDPTMVRPWNRPPRNSGYFSRSPRAFCIEKCNISRSGYHSKFYEILPLPRKKNMQFNFTKYCACHEQWHLDFTEYCACQEKWQFNFTKYCACPEKWHLDFTEYCACHEKWHNWTSPNTAPARNSNAHHWSSSHMNRYLQCAEQHVSQPKLTKYCACHEK